MNNANVIKRGDSWWVVLDNSTARKLFSQDVAELCELIDDGSNAESVIQGRTQLERLISEGSEIGVYLGDTNIGNKEEEE